MFSMVPIVVKARMAAKTGTSRKFASELSGPILEDDDGEDDDVSPGVVPLLLDAWDVTGRPKAGRVEYFKQQ